MGEETQVREKKVNEDELKMRETYEAFKEAVRTYIYTKKYIETQAYY